MRILFVCTGNTCRSPMAAFLAQQKIRAKGLDWQTESAGLFAMQGEPISSGALAALPEGSQEAVNHVSRSVSEELVQQADLILTMTAHHAWELRRRYPRFAGKIQSLGAFVQEIPSEPDPQYDIVDPYGGSDEQYRKTAAELNGLLDALFDRLTRPTQLD